MTLSQMDLASLIEGVYIGSTPKEKKSLKVIVLFRYFTGISLKITKSRFFPRFPKLNGKLFLIFTARVRSKTGRYFFSQVSVHRGWGWVPTYQLTVGVCTPSLGERAAQRVLATRWAVCLLRSRRRTSLGKTTKSLYSTEHKCRNITDE